MHKLVQTSTLKKKNDSLFVTLFIPLHSKLMRLSSPSKILDPCMQFKKMNQNTFC
jgi:hypothetical protein